MALDYKTKTVVLIVFIGSALTFLQYRLLRQSTVVRGKTAEVHGMTMDEFMLSGEKNHGRDLKLILFYTPLFGRLPWPGLTNNYNFTHWNRVPCRVQACKITYNKSHLIHSDAVIFHGRDLPSTAHMKQILSVKPFNQRWVYFMHESPKFTYYDPSLYNGFFNWTMSYRRDSDFFVPYRTYTQLGPDEIVEKQSDTTNYAKDKSRLAVWIVSHCKGIREDLVRKLMKYIKVDVFGMCSKRFNQTNNCPKATRGRREILRRYKFFLAFENSYCVDYITEKYWYTPLDHGIIPVVLGSPSYDQQVAIPGSFINAMDFSSIESLANYMLFLDKNDSAYNKYFLWRKQFKPVLPGSWTCEMCAALYNNSLPVKIYNNLNSYWGEEDACSGNERKVRRFVEQLN